MSSALPIEVTAGRLPYNYEITKPKQFFRDVIMRMKGVVPGSKVFIGTKQTGPIPNYDAGLWFNSGFVKTWHPATGIYTPDTRQFSNSGFFLTISATPTDVRTATFQNKTGTVALLIDVYSARATQLLTGSGNLTIDGSLSDSFYCKLSANATVNTLTVLEGQKLTFGVLNIGTAFTLTWAGGAGVKWPGGSAPTQPVATPGNTGYGLYILRNAHSVIYGEFINATPGSPSASVDTGGNPPKNYGGSGNTVLPVERIKNLP